MQLRRALTLSGLVLMLGLTASAALSEDWGDNKEDYTSGPEYEASKAACRAVKAAQPPAADRPGAAAAKALASCDSEALFYGIGMKADPVKARQCAFVEAATGKDDSIFSGERMLMLIYATGQGARQNVDLAIHYACGIEGAPAEMMGRIEHLGSIKTGDRPAVFDYCDDITSGYGEGECAAHEQRIADAARDGKIAALSSGWTPAQKAALISLRAAEKAWLEANAGEVDISGTARVSFIIEAQTGQANDFLALLTLVSSGKLPRVTPAQAKAADGQLNAVYGKVMKSGDEEDWGTVKKADIRNTQRAWLKYRDAWVAFAKVLAPGLPSESVVTWLTKKRIEALRAFTGEG